jgi:Fic family protein
MEVYSHPEAMEPMFPSESRELAELALQVAHDSARLSGCVHPATRNGIAMLVRSMNSYYSNLIEGHNTHPLEIERALKKDFSSDPAKRALQIESVAHVEVQESLEQRIRNDPAVDICSREFLCWIHEEFYSRLPEKSRRVKTKGGRTDRVVPGELRKVEVEVGRHIAPSSAALREFLERFRSSYAPQKVEPARKIAAAAASHHRLAWIHPFLDGNGRVARLFTHAYLIKVALDGHGLWTISRGLARKRDAYLNALAAADAQRWNDYDGRGNLSEKALNDFCKFFLNCCLDQIAFMTNLLEIDKVLERIKFFGELWARQSRKPFESVRLLQECFLRGELTRGEAVQLLHRPERTARRVIAAMLADQILTADSHVKPLRLGFPMKAVGYYFPRLFPEGVEMDMQSELKKG